MRSMKELLVLALVLTSVAACADLRSPGSAYSAGDRDQGFGDFGYSDVYRYYGGPSAVSQEGYVQRQQDRHLTEKQ